MESDERDDGRRDGDGEYASFSVSHPRWRVSRVGSTGKTGRVRRATKMKVFLTTDRLRSVSDSVLSVGAGLLVYNLDISRFLNRVFLSDLFF